MGSFLKWGLKITFTLLLELNAVCATDEDQVITRDVCIVGGGSSGTYAAVRLRDLGKSFTVIERQDVLGGHTETYTDPTTQETIDYGVVGFQNISIVRDYFARFDIPLQRAGLVSASPTTYVDFRTDQILPDYAPPDPSVALPAYAEQVLKYPYLENGFDLPDPVPEDLLLPFGDFVQKYNLSAIVQTLFTFSQGFGNLLQQPTLYVLKNVGAGDLAGLQNGFLQTVYHNNHELYDKALELLGSDVLLHSRVVSTDRSANNLTRVVVETPSGRKVILTRKLLIAMPPKLDNLRGFDLDDTEKSLFAQFSNSAYYTGILRNTGLSGNSSVVNIDPDSLYNLPSLPGICKLTPTTVKGLIDVKYGSPGALPFSTVKSDIIASVERLGDIGLAPEDTRPEFVAFGSHTPFELTVPIEAIKKGFYKDLYALQGRHNTFYTGAAFHTQDSALLWQFTEKLLASLQ